MTLRADQHAVLDDSAAAHGVFDDVVNGYFAKRHLLIRPLTLRVLTQSSITIPDHFLLERIIEPLRVQWLERKVRMYLAQKERMSDADNFSGIRTRA